MIYIELYILFIYSTTTSILVMATSDKSWKLTLQLGRLKNDSSLKLKCLIWQIE